MSAPFHSSLLTPAAERLRERMAGMPFTTPAIEVIHNVDVHSHPSEEAIRHALVEQANHPVLWADTLRAIAERGIRQVIECGPGKVLAPLARRTDERLNGSALVDRDSIEKAILALTQAQPS